MKIKGLTLAQIEDAARTAGHFKLDNVRSEGRYTLFVLRMASGTPRTCGSRSDGAVCTRPLGHEGECWHRDPTTRKISVSGWYGPSRPELRYRKHGISHMMYGRGPRYGPAVCFHGFRAFMYECFKTNPDAIIRTARAAYLGIEDFEAKFPAVGASNVGSQCAPVRYDECCDCDGTEEPQVRTIKARDIKGCPFVIFLPDHYREDGTCKCNDPAYREFMKRDWDYTDEAFRAKGLIP